MPYAQSSDRPTRHVRPVVSFEIGEGIGEDQGLWSVTTSLAGREGAITVSFGVRGKAFSDVTRTDLLTYIQKLISQAVFIRCGTAQELPLD